MWCQTQLFSSRLSFFAFPEPQIMAPCKNNNRNHSATPAFKFTPYVKGRLEKSKGIGSKFEFKREENILIQPVYPICSSTLTSHGSVIASHTHIYKTMGNISSYQINSPQFPVAVATTPVKSLSAIENVLFLAMNSCK